MPSESNSTCSSPVTKSVRFFSCLRVVLIPTKQEYIDAKLDSELWYREDEEIEFQGDATKEIISFIKKQAAIGDRVNVSEAKKALYQPPYNVELLSSPSLKRGPFVFEARQATSNKIQTSLDSANLGQTHTL